MEDIVDKRNHGSYRELQRRISELEHENTLLKSQKSRLEEKLNAALDGTGLCLWEQHVPTRKLTIFNMEWGKMLGFNPSELEATVDVWKSKLHPDDSEEVIDALNSHLAGDSESYQAVHRMLHKDGSHSWVSDRGRVVEFDDQGTPLRMMGTHIDITQEKRYELELSKLASLDPLTNLLNRTTLEQEFHQFCQTNKNSSSAIIFIDIDNFKAVNDHLGHKSGDNLLIQVAQWLVAEAPENAHVARLGGDEFVVFCTDTTKENLTLFSERILSHVARPIRLENGEAKIGFSIGICDFGNSEVNFDTVYQQADEAMYRVKRQGKNNVEYCSV